MSEKKTIKKQPVKKETLIEPNDDDNPIEEANKKKKRDNLSYKFCSNYCSIIIWKHCLRKLA